MKIAIVFIAVMLLSGCGVSETDQARLDNPAGISANQEVALTGPGAFGCQFENDFSRALDHYSKGETAAWAKIVFNEPYCFGGEEDGLTWTVLYVRGHVAKIGITTLKQYNKLDERQRERRKIEYVTAVKWLKPIEVAAK